MLVVGYIDVVVPIVLDEIHLTAARVVLVAVFAPLLCMAGGYMQVKRWRRLSYVNPLNDDRLRVDQYRRWRIADIDAAVKPRLSDTDRDSDIRGECGQGRGGEQ